VKAGALLAVVLLAGCGGSGDETRIRLVVPDENVREEGIECAGARPYQHVHRGAAYTIEAEDGDIVAEGELPAGRAENARPGVDWGVERIPTFCVLELEVELPARPRYRFRLDGGRPLEFEPGDEPITLIVS
jgi:hypothetical protein